MILRALAGYEVRYATLITGAPKLATQLARPCSFDICSQLFLQDARLKREPLSIGSGEEVCAASSVLSCNDEARMQRRFASSARKSTCPTSDSFLQSSSTRCQELQSTPRRFQIGAADCVIRTSHPLNPDD